MKLRSRKEVKLCTNCGSILSRHGYKQCRKCFVTLNTIVRDVPRTCIKCGGWISIGSAFKGKLCRECYDFARSHQGKPWQSKRTLERLYYREELSYESIGKKLGCGHTTVKKWCARFGIKPRPAPFMKRGNRVIGSNDYLWITVDGRSHPAHRIIAARFIGRPLLAREHIHHIDGDKANNLIENLCLMSNAEHRKFHNAPYPISSNLYLFVVNVR